MNAAATSSQCDPAPDRCSRMQGLDLELLRDELARRATRIVRDDHLAEDLVQEAFLRYLGASVAKGSEAPWLRRVLHNLCLDELRRRRKHAEVLRHRHHVEGPSAAESDEPDPLASAAAAEAQAAVEQTVQRMPMAMRSAFLMTLHSGASYAQLATAFDCNERTISTRVARARQRCRGALEKYRAA